MLESELTTVELAVYLRSGGQSSGSYWVAVIRRVVPYVAFVYRRLVFEVDRKRIFYVVGEV